MSQQRANQIWRKAETHRKACEAGYPSDNMPFEMCECCDQIVYTEPFTMNENTKQFEIYGFGYPLWFSFLKNCLLLLFVLIISKCANEIYTASIKNYDFCYGEDTHMTSHSHLFEGAHYQTGIHLRHSSDHLAAFDSLNQSSEGDLFEASQTSGSDQHRWTHFNIIGAGPPLKDGSQNPCTSFMVYLSFFQKESMIDNWFLKLVEFLAHLVTLIYFRNSILKEEQYYDERTCSPSDYTVVVSNLPESAGTRKSVERMFKYEFNKDYGTADSEIREILFVFQDKELAKLKEKKEDLERDLLKAEQKNDASSVEKASRNLRENQVELDRRAKEVRKIIESDEVKCDKVIVIMAHENDKAEVLEKYTRATKDPKNSYRKYFDGEWKDELLIKQCHEPNQIIWEYIDDSERNRKCRQFVGWIVTAFFLAIFTFVYYFVIKAKTKVLMKSAEEQSAKSRMPQLFKGLATGIILLASTVIVLFNKFVMGRIIKAIVKKEKHGYVDKENLSFAMKYAMSMFFTTALMALIIEAFNYRSFSKHHLGLIQDTSVMFVVTSILTPLVWVIHPYNILKKCSRDRAYGSLIPQKEANEHMEDYPYLLSKRYAEIFKLLWFTFLYAELIPLGAFIVFLGVVAYYWIDKWNFINNVSNKPGVSGKTAIVALKSIDATLLILPLGEFTFNLMFNREIDIMSIILCLVALIYLFIPITNIIWKYNDEKFKLQEISYENAKRMYRETYTSLHPVYQLTHAKENQTHRIAVRKYFEEEVKKAKYYGAGRGQYFKDTGSSSYIERRESRMSR